MDRWRGKVALVTGASAGIGRAVAKELVRQGLVVVGVARRIHLLEELSQEVSEQSLPGRLVARQLDVTEDEAVEATFRWADDSLGGVDVLVNAAGVTSSCSLLDGSPAEWRRLLDVNVVALCLCTREAVASMRRRQVPEGHIVHISSYSATVVPPHGSLHFYSASKHAVRALTEGLRHELRDCHSAIRVSSVSPGLVKTDIYTAALGPEFSEQVFADKPHLLPQDIASLVSYLLSAPPHVQVEN